MSLLTRLRDPELGRNDNDDKNRRRIFHIYRGYSRPVQPGDKAICGWIKVTPNDDRPSRPDDIECVVCQDLKHK